MEKNINKIIITLATIIISFFVGVKNVEAGNALGLCNIGYGSDSKGYGNYTTITNGDSDVAGIGYYRYNTKNCDGVKVLTDACESFDLDIYMRKKNATITDYSIVFISKTGKNLCKITPSNGGSALGNKKDNLNFTFSLLNGEIKKMEVTMTYKKGKKTDSTSKTITVNKKLGSSQKVTNPTGEKVPDADVTIPGNLANQTPEGWYMCNTTTGASKKQTQACVKKTKKDSIANCEKKIFKDKTSCETQLKVVTVTTTKTTKKKKTTTTTVTPTGNPEEANIDGGTTGKATGTKKYIVDEKGNIVTGQGTSCEDVSGLIHKYWSYVMIIVPILLIIMMVIDFFKALAKGDSESIKKAGNSAVKRTIAAVVLLALPALLGMIFDAVGLPLCV